MEKAFELALQKLEALAQILGTKVSMLYPYFVRQSILEGVLCPIYLVVALVAGYLLVFKFLPMAIKNGNIMEDHKATTTEIVLAEKLFIVNSALCVVFGVILVLCGLYAIVGLDSILKIFNPEYYAIKDLIKVINPK